MRWLKNMFDQPTEKPQVGLTPGMLYDRDYANALLNRA